MRLSKRTKGFQGGSIFRSVFPPKPINATAAKVGGYVVNSREQKKMSCSAKHEAHSDSGILETMSPEEAPFAKLPRIKYFRILDANDGCTTKYLLVIRLRNVEDVDTPSHVLRQSTIDCTDVKDLFETKEEAQRVGFSLKSCWGRKTPQKKSKEDWPLIVATASAYASGGVCVTAKDSVKLPEIAYFRVQYSQTFSTFFGNPWILLVSCRDGKGLRIASDVGHDNDVQRQTAFRTREDAINAGKKFQETWGRS